MQTLEFDLNVFWVWLCQARSLLHTLIIIGVCLGVSLGCIAISVPWLFPQIFTNDPAIISQVSALFELANIVLFHARLVVTVEQK